MSRLFLLPSALTSLALLLIVRPGDVSARACTGGDAADVECAVDETPIIKEEETAPEPDQSSDEHEEEAPARDTDNTETPSPTSSPVMSPPSSQSPGSSSSGSSNGGGEATASASASLRKPNASKPKTKKTVQAAPPPTPAPSSTPAILGSQTSATEPFRIPRTGASSVPALLLSVSAGVGTLVWRSRQK